MTDTLTPTASGTLPDAGERQRADPGLHDDLGGRGHEGGLGVLAALGLGAAAGLRGHRGSLAEHLRAG